MFFGVFLSNKKQKGTKTQGHFGSFFFAHSQGLSFENPQKRRFFFIIVIFPPSGYIQQTKVLRYRSKKNWAWQFRVGYLANRYRRKPTIIIILRVCVCFSLARTLLKVQWTSQVRFWCTAGQTRKRRRNRCMYIWCGYLACSSISRGLTGPANNWTRRITEHQRQTW